MCRFVVRKLEWLCIRLHKGRDTRKIVHARKGQPPGFFSFFSSFSPPHYLLYSSALYTSVSSLTLLLSLSLILLNSFVSPLRRHNSHSCILNLPSRPFYILLAFFCFNYVYLIHLSPSFLAFCDSFYSFYFIVYEIIREITFVIFYRGYVVSWIY